MLGDRVKGFKTEQQPDKIVFSHATISLPNKAMNLDDVPLINHELRHSGFYYYIIYKPSRIGKKMHKPFALVADIFKTGVIRFATIKELKEDYMKKDETLKMELEWLFRWTNLGDETLLDIARENIQLRIPLTFDAVAYAKFRKRIDGSYILRNYKENLLELERYQKYLNQPSGTGNYK